MGTVCGLTTVREAVLNAELHCSQFLVYADIPAYVKKLHEEFDAWTGGELIPESIVKEENEKLEQYFKEHP